jgi:cystathionine beta-lyase/cystathionine gamma-synthase
MVVFELSTSWTFSGCVVSTWCTIIPPLVERYLKIMSAQRALVVSSGMAALDVITRLLRPGDEVVTDAQDVCEWGYQTVCSHTLHRQRWRFV